MSVDIVKIEAYGPNRIILQDDSGVYFIAEKVPGRRDQYRIIAEIDEIKQESRRPLETVYAVRIFKKNEEVVGWEDWEKQISQAAPVVKPADAPAVAKTDSIENSVKKEPVVAAAEVKKAEAPAVTTAETSGAPFPIASLAESTERVAVEKSMPPSAQVIFESGHWMSTAVDPAEASPLPVKSADRPMAAAAAEFAAEAAAEKVWLVPNLVVILSGAKNLLAIKRDPSPPKADQDDNHLIFGYGYDLDHQPILTGIEEHGFRSNPFFPIANKPTPAGDLSAAAVTLPTPKNQTSSPPEIGIAQVPKAVSPLSIPSSPSRVRVSFKDGVSGPMIAAEVDETSVMIREIGSPANPLFAERVHLQGGSATRKESERHATVEKTSASFNDPQQEKGAQSDSRDSEGNPSAESAVAETLAT